MRKIEKQTLTSEDFNDLLLRITPLQKYIHIYTDGSYSSKYKLGGIGVFSPFNADLDFQEIYYTEAYQNTTNNRMELRAMIYAYEQLLKISRKSMAEKTTHKIPPVTIFTDSKYVSRGINEWYMKWEKDNYRNTQNEVIKNLDLWLYLIYLIRQIRPIISVNVAWVKGHSGNAGNEIADKLSTIYTFPKPDEILLTEHTRDIYLQAYSIPKYPKFTEHEKPTIKKIVNNW